MDASPDLLAETVRAKRVAVDNDLELLRVRLRKADPRRVDTRRWAQAALPVALGTGAMWWWKRRNHGVDSLEKLLIHELSDLYHVEQQSLPALQWMSARASNEELRKAFAQHRYETQGHLDRLQRVFRSVGARPLPGKSRTIKALAAEGKQLLKSQTGRHIRDAGLIATAQRVEHFEIAGYGTARTYAETLGHTQAAQLLQQTLEEERAADMKLTNLAERFVNPQSIRTVRPA